MNVLPKGLIHLIFLVLALFAGNAIQAQLDASGVAPPDDAAAHWVAPQALWLLKHPQARSAQLVFAPDAWSIAGPEASPGQREGLMVIPLWAAEDITPRVPAEGQKPPGLDERFLRFVPEPTVLDETASLRRIKAALKGALTVEQYDVAGKLLRRSQVQTAKLLDAVFTQGPDDADEISDFGAAASPEGARFRLWAPTAQAVDVLIFDKEKQLLETLSMTAEAHGDWVSVAPGLAAGAFYQYRLTLFHPQSGQVETLVTTDPYSLSLSSNSEYSQLVDLDDPALQPKGWPEHSIPEVAHPEDSILYEVHVRDFSALDTALSDPAHAGRYKAFSDPAGLGYQHLQMLQAAGLTHVHLLPSFDLASINEDVDQTLYPHDTLAKLCGLQAANPVCTTAADPQTTLQTLLESYDPTSDAAQQLVSAIRGLDGYNWGYDPFHYTVPEGSYASDPDGASRILEFREMVQSLHGMGFRVVMDVVYNHTFAAGLGTRSVLDRIVPGYYHRRHPVTGAIEQSTCCDNTATENIMMGKLMMDSLVVWARDYRIDGFRFDLMGHQPKALMLEARDRVWSADPDNYFYGEGWNFGEVADNRLFVQATQQELAGSEIGTFSDRLRDAVRGGSYNSEGAGIRRSQGIGNGLFTVPNELQPEDRQRDLYELSQDQLRIGLAGNLADFPLLNAAGEMVTGKDVPYGDGPTGYAQDPADIINYVSKHDNQTLWDNHQYRIAASVSTQDRVRMQVLSLAFPLLAQGIPFVHMGSELLRSKSFLRDSYDYGDWFNRVDFSQQSNNYHVGLPPAEKDEVNWPVIRELLRANQGRDQVSPEHIRYASEAFIELLRIRSASPLFRLRTKEEIIDRVRFLNAGPGALEGLIAMQIMDFPEARNLDPQLTAVVVLFNHSAQDLVWPMPGGDYTLHPVLAEGVDHRLRDSHKASKPGLFVPALGFAVYLHGE